MNPSGLRLEEKKSADETVASYKSTPSSRSSVLERAREYNRRIDEQRSRARSLERSSDAQSEEPPRRSKSATRATKQQRQGATRERAMASVRRDAVRLSALSPPSAPERVEEPVPTPRQQPSNRAGRSRSSAPAVNRVQPKQPQPQPVGAGRSASVDRPPARGRASNANNNTRPTPAPEEENGIVSPELLVDALSGHEDGLLAIAEKLMEHYDAGYDVMGEAIIDAFADVQKLFQHVVEAAHMEGAAFEASRREAADEKDDGTPAAATATQPVGPPNRHDEFIDQDVKDILSEAIRKGSNLRDRHSQCLQIYLQACSAASALFPVDSDHRGRLSLSMGRAEATSPDRACAILRYAMDDVLRSGLRAGQVPNMDPSKRADVVLSRPAAGLSSGVHHQVGVIQSSDEALASLKEEMKEILSAPVYNDTPLQAVAKRFWAALNDAQKSQQKNEERLEQNLGKLKGEFLLAQAEWEEKLTRSQEEVTAVKDKYTKLRESRSGDGYMDQARSFAHRLNESGRTEDGDGYADVNSSMFGSSTGRSFSTPGGKAASVASFGSGLAQQAKTIVSHQLNQFNCNAMNDRTGPVVNSELHQHHASPLRSSVTRSPPRTGKKSKAMDGYARSPQRLDV